MGAVTFSRQPGKGGTGPAYPDAGRPRGACLQEQAYPGKPRQQMAVETTWSALEDQPAKMMFRHGLAKVQLRTEDGRRIVGVGPDALSVHMLRPYQDPAGCDEGEGWEEFC